VTKPRAAKSTTTKDEAKAGPALDIVAAMNHPRLFAPWFRGESWDGWRAVLKAAYGLPMIDAEIAFFRTVAERAAEAEDVAAALTVAGEALRRYLDSGAQIYALTDDLFGSRRDEVEGWNRIAKSLPAPFADLQRRQPGVFYGGGQKLADAEASYWNVSIIKRDAA
jgi:hypothetical protein